jgi:hypothetical protein
MTRDDLMVLALWCAAVLALLSPVWFRPGFVFFNHGDLFSYHAPLRALTAGELQSGRLPFWDPYILLGVPHAANPQAVLFYPAALLCAFLPVTTGLVWDQVLHLLWAGAGMFLLARSQRLGRIGAFTLASAYALSPFLVYRVTAGIPTLLAALSWAPWLWLAWLSGSVAVLAGVFALQLLSGHAQFLVVNGCGMALWALCRTERGVLLKKLFLAGGGALALTALQWVLTAQYLGHSVRADWSGAMSGAYALPAGALWTWINPGVLGTPLGGDWGDAISVFYETCGGWVGPFALGLAALGLMRSKRRVAAFVLAAAGVLLAFGPRGPLSRALLSFTILSYLRTPSRWLFLTVWAAVLAAGAGLYALRGRRWPVGAKLAGVLAAFLPLAAWDAQFLSAQDPSLFLRPNVEVSETLAGRAQRVLTDPALANPNKAVFYRMMNVNGYEAFYPKAVPGWAAAAEGTPAADASRVFVSDWRSAASRRAGVRARLSPKGLEQGEGWPLAAFVDAGGARVKPDPHLWIERPSRWRVTGAIPRAAAGVALLTPQYPGWSARLDRIPTTVSSWDGIFQAVSLPGMRQAGVALDLTLEFRPTGWSWLAAFTAAAWAFWLVMLARRAGEAF